jgi:hypothetical protein
MEWLRETLTSSLVALINAGVWGFIVYKLGVKLLQYLDSSVGKQLSRLRRLGPAEFEIPQQPQVDEEQRALTPSAPASSLAAPDTMFGSYEAPIRAWLETLPAHSREDELVRSLVNWQMGWNFETINYSILGSQLQLLIALNSQALNAVQARAYYDQAVLSFPDYYHNHPYENWFGWLSNTVGLIKVAAESVEITESGRELLRYLFGRGYPLYRFG